MTSTHSGSYNSWDYCNFFCINRNNAKEGIFTFERIHNTKEQIFVYERAENHKAKERLFESFKGANFPGNILMQGRVKDSWKWGSYVKMMLVSLCEFYLIYLKYSMKMK